MTESADPSAGVLGNDLLEGANAIAVYLFNDETRRRSIYHLADRERGPRQLPVFYLGSTICSRKSLIDAWVKKLTAGAAALAVIEHPDANEFRPRKRGRARKAA